jgi:hypothetical protein
VRNRLKECPSCALTVEGEAPVCPYCGYEFPVPRAGTRATTWVMVALMVLFALPLLAWLLGWLG